MQVKNSLTYICDNCDEIISKSNRLSKLNKQYCEACLQCYNLDIIEPKHEEEIKKIVAERNKFMVALEKIKNRKSSCSQDGEPYCRDVASEALTGGEK